MSSGKTLLVEIGIEEAPSWFIESTLAGLPEIFGKSLERQRLDHSSLRVMTTPRRIAVIVEGLAERQSDESKQVTGPPAKIGVDGDGKFLPPAVKFAQKQGGNEKDLTVVETEKGKYVAVNVYIEGRPAKDILGGIIPEVFSEKGLPHHKSMRWGEVVGPFVRPVHWLVVILDGEVVPCSLFGVSSDRLSYGHRFHSPGKITIESPGEYEARLEQAHVIVDQQKRKKLIRQQLLRAASAAGGTLLEDAGLEEEVCNLVEWPVVVRGDFDRNFLSLPPAVIITVMAKHQRYFAVIVRNENLFPCFLAVANMDPALELKNEDEIKNARAPMIRGYERVLTARLEDGSFFFDEDKKKRLDDRLEALEGMVFQRGAGDYLLKSKRIEEIAGHIASQHLKFDGATVDKCARAALLSKADLASNMVYEFPELQGIMGGIYAREDGEDSMVADGIAEHYRPVSASGPLPRFDTGAVVSIADKIDSLTTFMSLGHKTSSGSDPLGFRRLCLGIIRVVLDKSYRINLRHLARFSRDLVQKDIREKETGKKEKKKKNRDPVDYFMEFLKDRLKIFWKDRARSDILDAALECGVEDIVRTRSRLEALIDFQKSEEFENLAVAFKRAYRISREIEGHANIDVALFEMDEEKNLYEAVSAVEPGITKAYQEEDFREVYSLFAGLRLQLDNYFDFVFVNVEDDKIKENRLAMMKMIADLVADAGRLDLIQFERTKLPPAIEQEIV